MEAVNDMPLAEAYRALARTGLVRRLLELARDEDLGDGTMQGDITSQVSIPASARSAAVLVARRGGIIAGLEALPELLDVFGGGLSLERPARDGSPVETGAVLARFEGPLRRILTIERAALNLVGRLSGVATRTAEFVDAIAGTRAKIYDTRKTTPGLRVLEKYAVRCGGGRCHRMGLHDAVLIKDNHIANVPIQRLGGVVAEASRRARAERPGLAFVEVEVDSIEQLREVLSLPRGTVDIVLLDNMDLSMLRSAVHLRDVSSSRPELEASGGVRLDSVAEIAAAGVDRISAGALTHSVSSLDVALDVEAQPA
jgi:nicotinate-nucleotide pyrophosphorylase (carboxylating)